MINIEGDGDDCRRVTRSDEERGKYMMKQDEERVTTAMMTMMMVMKGNRLRMIEMRGENRWIIVCR